VPSAPVCVAGPTRATCGRVGFLSAGGGGTEARFVAILGGAAVGVATFGAATFGAEILGAGALGAATGTLGAFGILGAFGVLVRGTLGRAILGAGGGAETRGFGGVTDATFATGGFAMDGAFTAAFGGGAFAAGSRAGAIFGAVIGGGVGIATAAFRKGSARRTSLGAVIACVDCVGFAMDGGADGGVVSDLPVGALATGRAEAAWRISAGNVTFERGGSIGGGKSRA